MLDSVLVASSRRQSQIEVLAKLLGRQLDFQAAVMLLPSYFISNMDRLASSHTAGTRTGRSLLIMFFALVLFRHSIVTVAGASPDSANVQGVGGVPAEDTSARDPIRNKQAGPNDVEDRVGFEGSSQPKIAPPAVGTRRVEGWTRKILGDISPPGMWPTPDGQDDTPVVNDEFRRRSLLTGSNSAPPLAPIAPLFIVMHSSEDGEDAFLRQALVGDKTYPVVHWSSIFERLNKLGSVINSVSLAFGFRVPEYLKVNERAVDDSSEKMEHRHDSFLTDVERTSSDSSLENEMQSGSGRFEESSNRRQQIVRVVYEEPKFRSRRSLLQGDISPPGMWPDTDDDESQLSEPVLLRRRRLMNL